MDGPPRLHFVHLLPIPALTVPVRDVAFSPDGTHFAIRFLHRVEVWRQTADSPPQLVETFDVGGVDSVARGTVHFAADGRSVLAAGYNGVSRCTFTL